MVMKKMSAAEFKARCLKVMDEVQATREAVLITKKGRPVAKLVPAQAPSNEPFGCLSGVVKIYGDIESPVAPLEAWEVLR
jgi:prevent-host-death family protein